MAKDRREYDGDVFYEVWASGRDPDRINYDRVGDHYYGGDSSDEAAEDEIRHMRQAEERRREEREAEEQREYAALEEQRYYEEMERERFEQMERDHYYRLENYDEHGYYK